MTNIISNKKAHPYFEIIFKKASIFQKETFHADDEWSDIKKQIILHFHLPLNCTGNIQIFSLLPERKIFPCSQNSFLNKISVHPSLAMQEQELCPFSKELNTDLNLGFWICIYPSKQL